MIDENDSWEIHQAAKSIIKHVQSAKDRREVNRILAELEPYPDYILTVKEVE